MKNLTQLLITILCVVLVFVVVGNTAMAASVNVTFKLHMGVQVHKGNINYGNDSVWLRGDMTGGWALNPAYKMVQQVAPHDTDYVVTASLPTGTSYGYKYYYYHNGDNWDADPNRSLVVGANDTTLEEWYNRDIYYSPPIINVTARVNMKYQIISGAFKPDSDIVRLAGTISTPNWGNSLDTLKPEAKPNDSIYSKTISIAGLQTAQYKFLKTLRKNVDWESVDNRTYALGTTDVTLPLVYFNNDSSIKTSASGEYLWHTDMTLMEQLGIFNRLDAHPDTVRIRGNFNGWSNGDGSASLLTRTPASEAYEITTYYDGFVDDPIYFKYYIQHDTTRAKIKFPSYSGNADRYDYEHPAEFGDANRVVSAVNGAFTTPYYWFNGTHPDGFIPAGDTITVTLQYDMRPAVASVGTAFAPSVDTVFLYLENFPWSSMQGYNNENTGLKFTDPDHDTIYTVTFNIVGPSDYEVLYRAHIAHMGGTTSDESAGLGQALPYHTRYIRPPFSNHQNYVFPLDTWKDLPPRYSEVPPFSDLAGSPTCVTLPISSGTSTGVTLNGTFRQNASTYFANTGTEYFDWGTSSAYGNTAPTSAPALSTGSLAAPITSLTPGTYHYRANIHVTGSDFITNNFPGLDQTFQITAAKWNIVSVPYNVSDYTFTTLYPTAASNAYDFEPSGYVAAPTLKNGVGYWVKWDSPTLVAMTGSPVTKVAVNVRAGWNLVGTVADDVPASSVTSTPAGIVSGNFWKYASGYTAVTNLSAGVGYWVKVTQAGILTIASPGVFKGTPNSTPAIPSALTKMNALVITDANGSSQTLYFGRNATDVVLSSYEMPPSPPAGAFDVRFTSGRMLEVVDNGKTATYPIAISTTAFPVTISWNVTSQNVAASLNIGDKPVVMSGKGSAKVTSASGVSLKLTGNATIPVAFSLSQNYPNPFNPTTNIKYSLPEDSKVKLTVFNLIGQEVVTLVNETQKAGYQSVQFNAANLPSGVYFYRIDAGKYNAVKKMVLIK